MTVDAVPILVIHGGAGVIAPTEMDLERALAFHAGLRQALRAGLAVLADGGGALDAVTEAVKAMEDDPLFNAGRGSVFTVDGRHEMDAAIMDGRDRRAGAVAGICGPRHPILAARAVMEKTEHVFLAGDGAARLPRDRTGAPRAVVVRHRFSSCRLDEGIDPAARGSGRRRRRQSQARHRRRRGAGWLG